MTEVWVTLIVGVAGVIGTIIVKVWLGRGKSKDAQEVAARKEAMKSVGDSLEAEKKIRDEHKRLDNGGVADKNIRDQLGDWNEGK